MINNLKSKIIFIVLFLAISLNATELLCLRKVTINVDTGETYNFTLEEAKSSPFFLNKKNTKTIILKLRSGTEYKYEYYKQTVDFKHYNSVKSNTHLRKMTNEKGKWFLDVNSNGEMLSMLLICVDA